EVMDELDFVVIPSRWYENSPLVLLNALATHTPVIVSNVEGLTEFVRDGVNGFAFERGNIASLAAVLRRIAEQRDCGRQLAAGTEYPMSTRAMVERTVEVYESVMHSAAH